jgi:hypothetical protein
MSRFTSRATAPVLLAALLMSLVLTAPVLNAMERLPARVFLTIPEGAPVPTIAVTAEPLKGGRYRLYLEARHFVFTDVCLNHATSSLEGHAHVHVNGQKVASAFTPWVELGPLPPGVHQIDVVLRGQDHRPLASQKGLIRAEVTINVDA